MATTEISVPGGGIIVGKPKWRPLESEGNLAMLLLLPWFCSLICMARRPWNALLLANMLVMGISPVNHLSQRQCSFSSKPPLAIRLLLTIDSTVNGDERTLLVA